MRRWFGLSLVLLLAVIFATQQRRVVTPVSASEPTLMGQSEAEVEAKSAGYRDCHGTVDEPSMHATGTVRLGCTDCHGGDAGIRVSSAISPKSREYDAAKRKAHVAARFAEDAR